MGNHTSTSPPETSITTATTTINFNNNLQLTDELDTYETTCKLDEEIQSFDTNLQARTRHVINTLAAGAEVHSLSFDSLKEVTECLLEMNQEVVKVVLDCKRDIWKSQELFELVEEYFESSLKTLDFCTVLEKCLKRCRNSQLLILVALQHYDKEYEVKGNISNRYPKTLEELKNFKALGDPFTSEFIQVFQSVYTQQMSMLDKLQVKKKKLDKNLKYIRTWRKVSGVIFIATFTSVVICSIVAAAIWAPPVAGALAAAVPLGSAGKWIDSLFRKYEIAIRGQKELLSSMQVGTYLAIKDLDNIRVLVEQLEIDIETLANDIDFALREEAMNMGVNEIKKKLAVFTKNVEDLGAQADMCSRDIRRARTVVLQRIIKHPNH